MSEQGKLKKRIQEQVFLDRQQQTQASFSSRVKSLEKFHAIVDEAKKEFPIYGNVEIELLKKRQIIQVRDAQEAFVHAIYDWFEKWFGEKE